MEGQKYSVEDLDLMSTHLEDSCINLQTKIMNKDLKDAEMEAKSILQRIRELRGTSGYKD
jgi:hypothetical protein